MSRDWGFRCKQDGETCKEFMYRRDVLRSVAENWPLIKRMQEQDTSGYIEITIMAYPHVVSDWWSFLDEHHAHGLELIDEYGDTEPIKEQEHV